MARPIPFDASVYSGLRKAEDSRHSAFDRLGYVACGSTAQNRLQGRHVRMTPDCVGPPLGSRGGKHHEPGGKLFTTE